MKPIKEKRSQETQLIRPEQRIKWVIPYACCSVMLLSGCILKTDEVDYGETGKILTEEEVMSSVYLDPNAIGYQEGDQVKLYYVKDGEVYYEVERSITDQELKDSVNRYQSIASIFGRLYKVGVGQRLIEGEEELEGVAYFDFEEGNETGLDYLKTNVVYRETPSSPVVEAERRKDEDHEEIIIWDEEELEPQTIESVEVEFGFTIQEGNGLFEIDQYPAVLELLNAVREVNLTEEEITLINQKVQEVMMSAMMAPEIAENSVTTEDSVVFKRGAVTEVFSVTPEAPHRVIFTMTLTDWFSAKEPVPVVE
mgnify:CR=1 FL=1